MYSGSGSNFSRGSRSPTYDRPTSPSFSNYPLTTSRSHTGVGEALGLHSSPFVEDGLYRTRSPIFSTSTPTTPTTHSTRGPLFNDLPHHLYSRYTDSRDYLSRTSNPYTTRSSLAPSYNNRPLSPTSTSRLSPSSTPSREWTRPSSPPPTFPSYSRTSPILREYDSVLKEYDTILREYDSLPTTPYLSRTTSPLSTRSSSPRPTLSLATTTLLTDRPSSPLEIPSGRITFVPQRTYHTVASNPDEGVKLTFPTTKSLVKETEDIAHELDKKNNQTARFIRDIDEQLGTSGDQVRTSQANHAPVKQFERTVVERMDDDVELTPRASPAPRTPRQSVQYDTRKGSVIEIPIKNEQQLINEVRKSMERLDDKKPQNNEDTSLRKRSMGSTLSPDSASPTTSSKRYDSGFEYEMTTSSYELRKKHEGKKEETQLMDKVKEYLPMIIGGLFAFLILMTVISEITRKPKAKSVTVKQVVQTQQKIPQKNIPKMIETVKVKMEGPAKTIPTVPSKKKIEKAIETVKAKVEPPVKTVSKVSSGKKMENKTEKVPSKVTPTTNVTKPCVKKCPPKQGKEVSQATNKTSIPLNKTKSFVVTNETVQSKIKPKSSSTASNNVTQSVVKPVKEVVNKTVKSTKTTKTKT